MSEPDANDALIRHRERRWRIMVSQIGAGNGLLLVLYATNVLPTTVWVMAYTYVVTVFTIGIALVRHDQAYRRRRGHV